MSEPFPQSQTPNQAPASPEPMLGGVETGDTILHALADFRKPLEQHYPGVRIDEVEQDTMDRTQYVAMSNIQGEGIPLAPYGRKESAVITSALDLMSRRGRRSEGIELAQLQKQYGDGEVPADVRERMDSLIETQRVNKQLAHMAMTRFVETGSDFTALVPSEGAMQQRGRVRRVLDRFRRRPQVPRSLTDMQKLSSRYGSAPGRKKQIVAQEQEGLQIGYASTGDMVVAHGNARDMPTPPRQVEESRIIQTRPEVVTRARTPTEPGVQVGRQHAEGHVVVARPRQQPPIPHRRVEYGGNRGRMASPNDAAYAHPGRLQHPESQQSPQFLDNKRAPVPARQVRRSRSNTRPPSIWD